MAGLAMKITKEEARTVVDILSRADAAEKTWILQSLIERIAQEMNAGRICIEGTSEHERPLTLLVLEKDPQNIRRITSLLNQLDKEEDQHVG